jgi:hypothetical protein
MVLPYSRRNTHLTNGQVRYLTQDEIPNKWIGTVLGYLTHRYLTQDGITYGQARYLTQDGITNGQVPVRYRYLTQNRDGTV